MNAGLPLRETRTTCCYCGVGCGVVVTSQGQHIVDVRGDPEHPANRGRLCTKGSTLHLTAAAHLAPQVRLLQPMQRTARGAAPQAIGWDAALDTLAERIAATRAAHGPDAIGFYVSGQLLTEDYYVFNKLARALVGTNGIDSNSRLCMSSAVAGYKATLGADAPPGCYDDFAQADLVFLSGSNLAWAHPVLCRRLEEAKAARPTQRWIAVDPRRTETAAMADLHLAILPGSDVALAHGLLHVLCWEGRLDEAFIARHTQGFDALRSRVRECTPRATARATGLREEDIITAAQWWGASQAVLSLYCQGLNQSTQGTANTASLINLHLATGQIGRPGCGPFSLTGQPNAMGGREVGALANLLGGHREAADAEDRAAMAALWGVDDLPARPGRSAVEMFQAAADGEIRLLWIACTNPAQSMPDQATVRRALERAEFVVVQEALCTTATAACADLLLPAASWGEKEGTVTNSERRISRVRAAVPAPGDARPDWRIAADVAQRLEARLRPGRPSLFGWKDAEAVWCEHRETTRGRDLDITGLDYALLERAGPQQWPCPSGATAGRARLYEDGRFATADGRARFFDAEPLGVAEPCDEHHPWSLCTGRLRDQWHGMSRTGLLGRLNAHAPQPVVELAPQDLLRLGLIEGDLVRIVSRRGELVLPAAASAAQARSQAFIAMHWGEEVLPASRHGVNALTLSDHCATSKQPELKHCAVRLERAALPWRLRAMAWLPQSESLARRERLRPWLAQFGYAACLTVGREPDERARVGLWLDAAAREAPPAHVLQHLRAEMDLEADGDAAGELAVLDYRDARAGSRRSLVIERDDRDAEWLVAYWFAGAAAADATLAQDCGRRLLAGIPLEVPARSLLAGRPGGLVVRTPTAQLCACHDVSETAVRTALACASGDAAARVASAQKATRCGTGCGSCLPALRRMAEEASGERATIPG